VQAADLALLTVLIGTYSLQMSRTEKVTILKGEAKRSVGSGELEIADDPPSSTAIWKGVLTLDSLDDPTVIGVGEYFYIRFEQAKGSPEVHAAVRTNDTIRLNIEGTEPLPR
jgi:hypothetical protein